MRFALVVLSGSMVAVAALECLRGECPAQDAEDIAEAALLQTRTSTDWDLWGSHEGPEHYVQMDPPAKVPIPREVVGEGFVRELLITYPLKTNPIKVQGKTAAIDIHKFMTGTYSRDSLAPATKLDPLGDSREIQDYGVEIGVLFATQISMISTKVKLAFAEKSHTLWMPDGVKRFSEAKDKRGFAKQSAETRAEAKKYRDMRHTALSGLSMPIGSQILEGGRDEKHVKALRDYVADNRQTTDADLKDLARAKKEMAHRHATYKAKKPIRSAIGCIHVEGAELMKFTENTIEVPLDTKIVAWRGQLASAPNKWYSMSSGIVIFSHDKETDSFQIYFRFSSAVDISDGAKDYTSAFLRSPVNGLSTSPVGVDGRKSTTNADFAFVFSQTVQHIPTDYSFLRSNRKHVGCPDEVLHSLPQKVDTIQDDLAQLNEGKLSVPLGFLSTHVVLSNCAVGYLKPAGHGAVSYDRLMAMGLSHVLMEMPGEVMVAAFTNSSRWNKLDLP